MTGANHRFLSSVPLVLPFCISRCCSFFLSLSCSLSPVVVIITCNFTISSSKVFNKQIISLVILKVYCWQNCLISLFGILSKRKKNLPSQSSPEESKGIFKVFIIQERRVKTPIGTFGLKSLNRGTANNSIMIRSSWKDLTRF